MHEHETPAPGVKHGVTRGATGAGRGLHAHAARLTDDTSAALANSDRRLPPGPRGSLPEARLARTWQAQAFAGDALRTADGVPVQVIFPGRPGGRSGPDFRDAIVRVGDTPPRTGDIELHRDARDFAGHGHAADPAYDRVLLHVVWRAGDATVTTLASGRRVPIVAVAPATVGAPATPLREPCAAAPRRLGAEPVRAVLREAGLWRLERKARSLADAIERQGAGQALYTALAVALGQTANAHAFALLTERVPLTEALADVDGSPEQAAAVINRRLLHAAGLDGALLAPVPALPWVTHGLRPAAWPGRRIGALARLLARLARPDPVATARAAVRDALSVGPRPLLDLLTVRLPGGPALCGRARAVEVAVNGLLPWASACATLAGDDEEAARVLVLAERLPAGERYGPLAHLDRNLRDARGRPLLGSALRQQGALAFLGEWCRRGGCGRCPLS